METKTRHSLSMQMLTLDTVTIHMRATLRKAKVPEGQVEYHMAVLRSVRNTLAFMQDHEQTIREAIAAQRTLDAVATHG
jgi:hypothetical protein